MIESCFDSVGDGGVWCNKAGVTTKLQLAGEVCCRVRRRGRREIYLVLDWGRRAARLLNFAVSVPVFIFSGFGGGVDFWSKQGQEGPSQLVGREFDSFVPVDTRPPAEVLSL